MMHNEERLGGREEKMSTTTAAQDIAALTALNQDYIASVQRGDVRRFDEILAADFLWSTRTARWSIEPNSWRRLRGQ
jgi:hypothetical protein